MGSLKCHLVSGSASCHVPPCARTCCSLLMGGCVCLLCSEDLFVFTVVSTEASSHVSSAGALSEGIQ